MNLTRLLYLNAPTGLRHAVALVLPEPVKARVRHRVGPTRFSQPEGPVTASWDNADISLYLDPDYQHKPHVRRSQELVLEYLRQTVLRSAGAVSLLDAACGNGRLYRALEEADFLRSVDYRGLDMSPKLVEAARRISPGGAFELGSIEAMPYAAESFDVVVTQHVLRYLESYEAAVRELLRVSRRVVILVEKEAADEDRLGTYYNETLGSFFPLNLYDPAKLKAFARANGASLAFTLNDSRVDDPDGQAVYVFYKPAP